MRNTRSERAVTGRRARWKVLLLASAVLGSTAAVAALHLTRDPRPGFLERRGSVAAIETERTIASDAYERSELRLTSTSGLSFELTVKRPIERGDEVVARPLLILLGGHTSGRDAIDLIDDTDGAVIAALSYPFEGSDRIKGFDVVRAVPRIRRALLDTPPALLLAIEHLAAEPYVDARAIELVGVSLGAPFVCIAGALDTRVKRVWSIHGAGDPYALLEHSLARKIPFTPARMFVAGIAHIAACGPGIAPEHWVGEISPRPFIMVNADADERLPRACVDALFDAALEPREMIWRPGLHVNPSRKGIVQDLVDLVLARVDADRVR